ncbi:hypothetical protein QO002_000988 [Pararhizobium capsulatum DSM 1112]|uniref:Uncharacterized protein n=1 Tax=Pararhizobium capsulatum DSM 1112 TaxID=1121113 RepID=A0ABU0BKS6_9HYPH|nr:hypothetical protein [Pararhizobium capsulatum DSM 1112]
MSSNLKQIYGYQDAASLAVVGVSFAFVLFLILERWLW